MNIRRGNGPAQELSLLKVQGMLYRGKLAPLIEPITGVSGSCDKRHGVKMIHAALDTLAKTDERTTPELLDSIARVAVIGADVVSKTKCRCGDSPGCAANNDSTAAAAEGARRIAKELLK